MIISYTWKLETNTWMNKKKKEQQILKQMENEAFTLEKITAYTNRL